MCALQLGLDDQPVKTDAVHAAFYAAAHTRLSAALGDEGRQVALDTIIDLYRNAGRGSEPGLMAPQPRRQEGPVHRRRSRASDDEVKA